MSSLEKVDERRLGPTTPLGGSLSFGFFSVSRKEPSLSRSGDRRGRESDIPILRVGRTDVGLHRKPPETRPRRPSGDGGPEKELNPRAREGDRT